VDHEARDEILVKQLRDATTFEDFGRQLSPEELQE
jgi:hypothetical protein